MINTLPIEITVTVKILTTSPDTGLQADAVSPPTVDVFDGAAASPLYSVTSTRLSEGSYVAALPFTAASSCVVGHSYNVVENAIFGTDTFRNVLGTVTLVPASTAQTADVATAIAALTNLSGRIPDALVSGQLKAVMTAISTGAITATAFAAGAIDASALNTSAVTEIVAAIRAMVVESNGNVTLQQAISVIYAVGAGLVTDNGDTFKDPTGASVRAAFITDVNANRTGATLTPSA